MPVCNMWTFGMLLKAISLKTCVKVEVKIINLQYVNVKVYHIMFRSIYFIL